MMLIFVLSTITKSPAQGYKLREKDMTTKVLIQDELTGQYYGVQCAANPKGYLTSDADEGSPGPHDFPFWTDDIEEAYNFGTERSAENEMATQDVTVDGTRKPIIVTL